MSHKQIGLYSEEAQEAYRQARKQIVEEVFDGERDDFSEQDVVRELAACYTGGDADPDSPFPYSADVERERRVEHVPVPVDYDRLTGHDEGVSRVDTDKIPRK